MSEQMIPIPFRELMTWIMAEYPQGVRRIRKAAKLPTAARFIRPCAKVFAIGENACTPDSRREP